MPRSSSSYSPIRHADKYSGDGKIKILITDCENAFQEVLANPDSRPCDEISILSQEIEIVQKVFTIYGSSVTKLFWSNSEDISITKADIVKALNMLPNLKSLHLSSFKLDDNEKIEYKLALKNLESLEINGSDNQELFRFYAQVLPRNSIKNLEIEMNDGSQEFFKQQTQVKNLRIINLKLIEKNSLSESGLQQNNENEDKIKIVDDEIVEKLKNKFKFFKDLNLDEFVCSISNTEKEIGRVFVKFVLKTQPNLRLLHLVKSSDYNNEIVDDDLFAKICETFSLEELYIAVDQLTNLTLIQNLLNLKKLRLKTITESSLKLFQELSSFKLSTISSLSLDLWSFEIPAETYEAFSINMPNLKDLNISLGTRHKINFFAKVFQNLESLSVKFGDANRQVNLENVYELDSNISNHKLKKICLDFTGNENIPQEKFFDMLKMFPNLKILNVSAKFTIDAEFYILLYKNLQNIQEIKFSSIPVKLDDEFKPNLLSTLKSFAEKLKFISILFINKRKRFDPEVTFNQLISALQGVYEFEERGYTINCQVNMIEIFSGKQSPNEEVIHFRKY